jgi:hypothetical protein
MRQWGPVRSTMVSEPAFGVILGHLNRQVNKVNTAPHSTNRRAACRRKMRMSGLRKVEMFAFMDGLAPYGNGANRFEPTRTGPIESVARGVANASFADSCSGALKVTDPAADAAADSRARGWCSSSRITRPAHRIASWRPRWSKRFWRACASVMRISDPRWPPSIWPKRVFP